MTMLKQVPKSRVKKRLNKGEKLNQDLDVENKKLIERK